MSTTNGTKAILAAKRADEILIGALVNASAVAKYLNKCGKDVTLLCAGTGGKLAVEDYVGAGAVVARLRRSKRSKVAQQSADLFRLLSRNLAGAIRHTRGGANVIAAGLEADIDFAARIDVYDFVGRVLLNPLRVVRG
jgi:2-phosphosulfolactate phosphatase